MSVTASRLWILALAIVVTPPLSTAAQEGVTELSQSCALAGSCLPADAPGFPITIDQTGSYRLTGDLQVPDENTTAIDVTADHVTINLGGFAIRGITSCAPGSDPCAPTGGGHAIDASGTVGLSVSNGALIGLGGTGLLAGDGCLIHDVYATENGAIGIDGREYCLVADSHVHRNQGVGIDVTERGLAAGNRAIVNRSAGIVMVGLAVENVADGNRVGLSVGSGVALRNTSRNNEEEGLRGGRTLFHQNSLVDNTTSAPTTLFELSASGVSGFRENVIRSQAGNTTDGTDLLNMGANACDDALCP